MATNNGAHSWDPQRGILCFWGPPSNFEVCSIESDGSRSSKINLRWFQILNFFGSHLRSTRQNWLAFPYWLGFFSWSAHELAPEITSPLDDRFEMGINPSCICISTCVEIHVCVCKYPCIHYTTFECVYIYIYTHICDIPRLRTLCVYIYIQILGVRLIHTYIHT